MSSSGFRLAGALHGPGIRRRSPARGGRHHHRLLLSHRSGPGGVSCGSSAGLQVPAAAPSPSPSTSRAPACVEGFSWPAADRRQRSVFERVHVQGVQASGPAARRRRPPAGQPTGASGVRPLEPPGPVLWRGPPSHGPLPTVPGRQQRHRRQPAVVSA